AAMAGVEAVDARAQPARPEPLHEQLRIGVGTEEELARCIELPGDHDLRHPGLCADLRLCHGAFLSTEVSDASGSAIVLQLCQQRVEPVVALVPVLAVAGQPGGRLAERRRL